MATLRELNDGLFLYLLPNIDSMLLEDITSLVAGMDSSLSHVI